MLKSISIAVDFPLHPPSTSQVMIFQIVFAVKYILYLSMIIYTFCCQATLVLEDPSHGYKYKMICMQNVIFSYRLGGGFTFYHMERPEIIKKK